jgi:hypothetical protein
MKLCVPEGSKIKLPRTHAWPSCRERPEKGNGCSPELSRIEVLLPVVSGQENIHPSCAPSLHDVMRKIGNDWLLPVSSCLMPNACIDRLERLERFEQLEPTAS